MSNEYNLDPNEVLIMQNANVALISGEESKRLNEVVLTNKNLILVNEVSVSLFSSQRMLKRCPLDLVACCDGIPQAFIGKHKNKYVLQVVFTDEAITLHFPEDEKREARRWADAIKYTIVGDIDSIDTTATLPNKEIDGLISGITGFMSTFVTDANTVTGTTTKPNKPLRKPSTSKATAKCIGCHAPLLGAKGSIVTCEYCGSKQTL